MNLSIETSDKRTLTIDDYAKIENIEDPNLSPNGERVVFTVKSPNLEKNRNDRDIYLVSTSGGEMIKLTDDGQSSLPTWSPDGKKIAFLQKSKEKMQIWLMSPSGENKRKITDYEISNAFLGWVEGTQLGSDTLCWAPDGSLIAFLASLEPVDPKKTIKVIKRAMYKSFYGFSDLRRRHIFVVSPVGEESPCQLTFGDFDEHSLSWSPDSREIAFISNRSGKADLNMQTDIWTVNVKNREINRITNTKGAEYNPAWSPNGRYIAYMARQRANTSNESTPEDAHIWVINPDGSNARDLTVDLDRTCTAPQWTPDGEQILFTVYDRGNVPIFATSPEGRGVIQVTKGNRWIAAFCLARNKNRMAFVATSPTNPGQLYVADRAGDSEVQLTRLNQFLETVHLCEPEEFTFQSFDGTEIQGWFMVPKDFDPTKKYPGLLNIKGGPSSMRGYEFRVHHQLGPANGYVEFYINYRGSSGYGQAFSDAVAGDMLGGEFQDNMEVVDYILRTQSYVDADRLGVFGVSYGGYLTNWIVTQTDRFKAAVPISSISNLWSQWGTSAIPLWVEAEIEGYPWEQMDRMLKQSPLFHAHRVKTPVLFLHGELDFDTPIGEAEQMFMVLKKIGIESMMVRYTEEGHGVTTKPANQMDVLRRIVAWFDKHLKSSISTT